jgi:Spy/CpxP family protein refolding chaperone
MLKKLVPAVLGALLVASPVLAVTTAAAADQAQPSTMKAHHKASHHKAMKHHKMASHHMMKKHAKAKKTPPKA